MRIYASIEDARQAFEPFARLEPRLWQLWDVCRSATPPRRAEPLDDAYGVDPFENDELAADLPGDGWCAEEYFLHNVKSKLLVLVGVYRPRGPSELLTSEAYETVYDVLLNWALARSCVCCSEGENEGPSNRGDDGHPAHW